MIDNHYVVACVPSGRKRYMELLLPQLVRNDLIDEIRLWVNTVDPVDLRWIREQQGDKVRLEELPEGTDGSTANVSRFYRNCVDRNTVYLKIDDDVVWIEPDGLEELLSCRMTFPQPFLVYPNIVNNVILSSIHQQNGCYKNIPALTRNPWCSNGWGSGDIAVRIHEEFLQSALEGNLDRYRFSPMTIHDYLRVSINVICWFGKDFAEMNLPVPEDDENYLSCIVPKKINRPNMILGGKTFVHYAYYTQRELMDRSTLLNRYENIVLKPHENNGTGIQL